MRSPYLFPERWRSGFTLIELLVAMVTLSFLVLMLSTMMSYVLSLWTANLGAVDNFAKARTVLNVLDRDIQEMVLRRDLAAFPATSGVPACSFYTNVQGDPGTAFTGGNFDTRTVSLVQYLLDPKTALTTTTSPALLRYNYGMNFQTTTGAVPTIGTTTSLPTPGNANLQTDVLCKGIVAFQIQFVDGTGTIQPTFSYSFTQPAPTSNSCAVIVSMAVLSNSAYTLAGDTGNLLNVSGCFSTTTPTNQTYSQVWNAALNAPSTTFLSLPAPVRSGIRVFERHVPLPITPPSH